MNMDYIKRILDGTDDKASSKRFVGLVAFAASLILAIVGMFAEVNTHYFDAFLLFAATAFGISEIGKFLKGKSKQPATVGKTDSLSYGVES